MIKIPNLVVMGMKEIWHADPCDGEPMQKRTNGIAPTKRSRANANAGGESNSNGSGGASDDVRRKCNYSIN